jgi:anti-anti-sigma regulatory factor
VDLLSNISYPGIDFIREKINRAVIETKGNFSVKIDFSKIPSLDYTSIRGIESLTKDLKKQNIKLELLNLNRKCKNKF